MKTAYWCEAIKGVPNGAANAHTVRLTTIGADLPAGLSVATTYYVIEADTNTFELSATEGGTKIDIGDAGSGTHTWHQYSIGKASGYSTKARYNTKAFPVSSAEGEAQIDLIQVEFETLALGATVDMTLTYNKSASTQSLTQITYSATDATTRRKILNRGFQLEDLRLDISWENGSVSNPVKIRSIYIAEHFIKSN